MTNSLLTDNPSLPVNGAKRAKFDINSASGNLTIDQSTHDGQALASRARSVRVPHATTAVLGARLGGTDMTVIAKSCTSMTTRISSSTPIGLVT